MDQPFHRSNEKNFCIKALFALDINLKRPFKRMQEAERRENFSVLLGSRREFVMHAHKQ